MSSSGHPPEANTSGLPHADIEAFIRSAVSTGRIVLASELDIRAFAQANSYRPPFAGRVWSSVVRYSEQLEVGDLATYAPTAADTARTRPLAVTDQLEPNTARIPQFKLDVPSLYAWLSFETQKPPTRVAEYTRGLGAAGLELMLDFANTHRPEKMPKLAMPLTVPRHSPGKMDATSVLQGHKETVDRPRNLTESVLIGGVTYDVVTVEAISEYIRSSGKDLSLLWYLDDYIGRMAGFICNLDLSRYEQPLQAHWLVDGVALIHSQISAIGRTEQSRQPESWAFVPGRFIQAFDALTELVYTHSERDIFRKLPATQDIMQQYVTELKLQGYAADTGEPEIQLTAHAAGNLKKLWHYLLDLGISSNY